MNLWMRKLFFGLLLCCGQSLPAMAATEIVEVYFLPLQEAADAAKSQLSDDGKVATIASKHILIIDDDQAYINKATALLKRLDHLPEQYTAYINIENITSAEYSLSNASGAVTTGRLPGGWVMVTLQSRAQHSGHRQSFQLRISGNQPASMETGTLRSFSRETRLWLSGYGLVQASSVEMIPVTSGFHILVRPVGTDQIRVRITPWMKRVVAEVQGQHELLFDLGRSSNPATPPSSTANMRLNARPVLQKNPSIELIG
ncbi:MAG: type II and III secretion system family protein, partial [Mariprofundus sp.]|nr:type II and III secretion system family protein [Mariprofundus sp.]